MAAAEPRTTTTTSPVRPRPGRTSSPRTTTSRSEPRLLALAGGLIAFLVFSGLALAAPELSKLRYKIKPDDGNRWARLLGGAPVVRGSERPHAISFTFDDGPDHRTTPLLLSALARHHIKASFFVNGHRFHAETAGGLENAAVLRRMLREGHFVGNHGFAHRDISTLDDETWRSEVGQVESMIRALTATRPFLFRPPFGRVSPETLTRLSAEGYTAVMWNLDPLDWQLDDPRLILARARKVLLENPGGGIFLMHDTNRASVEAFPLIVEWIAEQNSRRRARGEPVLEIVGIDAFVRAAR